MPALFRQLGVPARVAEEFNSLFFRGAVDADLPTMTPARRSPTATPARSTWPTCSARPA
ncbi:MAG: hypothetical protein FWE35_25325 [Streptosporangiales bacterium]|nr:hypothetical protein [Streptosporangiales bacterium]